VLSGITAFLHLLQSNRAKIFGVQREIQRLALPEYKADPRDQEDPRAAAVFFSEMHQMMGSVRLIQKVSTKSRMGRGGERETIKRREREQEEGGGG